MQSDINIKCCKECPVEDIVGFCDTCKKVFCKECMVDHIGHTIVKIKDYCEEKKTSVYELATQLEEKRRELIGREVKLKEGPAENSVAPFVSGKESFSKEKACINCSVDVFCACEGANVLFDVGSVLRKELIDVGQ